MRSKPAVAPQSVAVEALYRKYGPLIYARCRKVLRDEQAAQDATQEVFLRVMRHLDKVPPNATAAAWLSRISINYCLNVIRDAKKTQTFAELPERSGGDPERVLLDRDLANRLLSQAPAPLRDSVIMHHVQGLKQGQVATALGVSRRTVIYRLDRFCAMAERFRAKSSREAA